MRTPDLNEDEIYEFAKVGATDAELADFYGCDESLIPERFAGLLARARAEGRMTLRKLLWTAAEKGTASVQVFLSKLLCPPDVEDEPPLIGPDEQAEMLENDETLERVCARDEHKAAPRPESRGVRVPRQRRQVGLSQTSRASQSEAG